MKPEQIDKDDNYAGRKYKKELKKQMKRKRRREEKRLLDNAHIKNEYCGWSI